MYSEYVPEIIDESLDDRTIWTKFILFEVFDLIWLHKNTGVQLLCGGAI